MQHNRKTLSIKLAPREQSGNPEDLLSEAIERGYCVTATYNGGRIKLAPHILYEKNGGLYVDGVVVDRDGKPPREIKLGSFNLAGLSGIAVTRLPLSPRLPLDQANPKYAGTVRAALSS
jgi:hypothetical protein